MRQALFYIRKISNKDRRKLTETKYKEQVNETGRISEPRQQISIQSVPLCSTDPPCRSTPIPICADIGSLLVLQCGLHNNTPPQAARRPSAFAKCFTLSEGSTFVKISIRKTTQNYQPYIALCSSVRFRVS